MMKWIICFWFTTITLFIAVMHARIVVSRDRGELSAFWWFHFYILGALAALMDVGFNMTFGSIMYLELPEEWLFTSRCQRHKLGSGWRQRVAGWWCRQLNYIDPGHC